MDDVRRSCALNTLRTDGLTPVGSAGSSWQAASVILANLVVSSRSVSQPPRDRGRSYIGTQNQALRRCCSVRDVGRLALDGVGRAREAPASTPTVLSRDEVTRLFAMMDRTAVARLLCGTACA
jgi:hypothetical protein